MLQVQTNFQDTFTVKSFEWRRSDEPDECHAEWHFDGGNTNCPAAVGRRCRCKEIAGWSATNILVHSADGVLLT